MDDLIGEFITETSASLSVLDAELESLRQDPARPDLLRNIERLVHTIKSTCGFLGLTRLEALAQAIEAYLERFAASQVPHNAESIRPLLDAIARIREMLSEVEVQGHEPAGDDGDILQALAYAPARVAPPTPPATAPVIAKAPAPLAKNLQQKAIAQGLDTPVPHAGASALPVATVDTMSALLRELAALRPRLQHTPERAAALDRLSEITLALGEQLGQVTDRRIGELWRDWPTRVRDWAIERERECLLELHGANTRMPQALAAAIENPLLDTLRFLATEAATGDTTLTLAAAMQSGQLVLTLAMPGSTVDMLELRRALVAANLIGAVAADAMGEAALLPYVLHPSVRLSSLQGVGLQQHALAWRHLAMERGGHFHLESRRGEGTVWRLQLPLTLPMLDAALLEIGGQYFAVPHTQLLADAPLTDAAESYPWQGQALPLRALGTLLGNTAGQGRHVAVLQSGAITFALRVDSAPQRDTLLVQPLHRMLRGLVPYSGVAALPEQRIAFVFDLAALAHRFDTRALLPAPASQTTAALPSTPDLLLFAAGGATKAVPLSAIQRLERYGAEQWVEQQGAPSVPYQDGWLRLVVLPGTHLPKQGRITVIACRHEGGSLGIVAERVLDVQRGGTTAHAELLNLEALARGEVA